jgi:hypothetical protein
MLWEPEIQHIKWRSIFPVCYRYKCTVSYLLTLPRARDYFPFCTILSSHVDEDSDCGLLGYGTVVQSGKLVPTFRKNILPPYSVLNTSTGKCTLRMTLKRCASFTYYFSYLWSTVITMCTTCFNTKKTLNFSHRVYSCAPFDSHNIQLLFASDLTLS